MHLAFDAKRAFHNRAGLGNYSRNLLQALVSAYPEHRYSLYTPTPGKRFEEGLKQPYELVAPTGFSGKVPTLWRSVGIAKRLKDEKPDLYHGLSHELPLGIKQSGVKSVVTMHDLIFERYPEWYSPIDRLLYRTKYRYSCHAADRIIAIGQQTANDLQERWNLPAAKIDIVRQSCHPSFWEPVTDEFKKEIGRLYRLPAQFILQVGTIEPRKNQLTTLKALITDNTGIPVVFVGRTTSYLKQLKKFINRHRLHSRVSFLSQVPGEHLPALYQMATITTYPSIFEGFGIPVLESIVSGTPVVTSDRLCFTDAGGTAAHYISPYRPDELSHAIDRLLSDHDHYQSMVARGREHRNAFTPSKFAANTMDVYQKVMQEAK
jgi:glycosyltransferase involved in cell wall biosynthesis